MKKILGTMFALTLVSGLCFAQAPEAVKAPVAAAADMGKPAVGAAMEAVKVFHGKIESVSVADAAKGTKSEIVAVDDSGKKMNFLVNPNHTTIYDAALQPITLDKIKVDDKVLVKYEANKYHAEINEAQSISLVK